MNNDLTANLTEALVLLFSGDAEIWAIIWVSFSVSVKAILIALPVGFGLAFLLAYADFPGRRFLVTVFNSLLSVPAVVVGLTLYLLLSRQGPLGDLRLLFTQDAMVLGQIALSLPILVAMGHSAYQGGDRRAWETALTLGASRVRAVVSVTREVKFALLAALVAGFGRIIAEVGASMMLGGNIQHYTRNIPTAIALETSKGAFAQGIALGLVLLVLALLLSASLSLFQGKGAVGP